LSGNWAKKTTVCCSFDLLKLDEGHLIQKHVGPKPVAIEDERRNARAMHDSNNTSHMERHERSFFSKKG
jgi:hypothetical protein